MFRARRDRNPSGTTYFEVLRARRARRTVLLTIKERIHAGEAGRDQYCVLSTSATPSPNSICFVVFRAHPSTPSPSCVQNILKQAVLDRVGPWGRRMCSKHCYTIGNRPGIPGIEQNIINQVVIHGVVALQETLLRNKWQFHSFLRHVKKCSSG